MPADGLMEKIKSSLTKDEYEEFIRGLGKLREAGRQEGRSESVLTSPDTGITLRPVIEWLRSRLAEPSSWVAGSILAYLADNAIPALSQYQSNKWLAASAAVVGFVLKEARKPK